MIGRHISDRFFQRYGQELSVPDLRDMIAHASRAPDGEPDRVFPNRRHISFYWRGLEIRMVWDPKNRFIFTFLPQRTRTAWCLPKRRRA
jgi:hypothetical protein